MIILDNLAYQHADEWAKYGFTIVDVFGKNAPRFNNDDKIVICRPVIGVEPEIQLYNEVEGADASLLPPKLMREKVEGVDTEASIDAIISRVSAQQVEKPQFAPVEKEPEQSSAPSEGVDEPFL